MESEFNFDWEERSEQTPFKVHMVAGSLAGLAEHILLLPIDNIKTHVQATTAGNFRAIRNISRKGFPSFYSGAGITALGCVPAHALFFLNYEYVKSWLGTQGELSLFRNLLLGASSALCHDAIMTPCDMIKQRVQLTGAAYSFVVRDALRREGLISFWRSFPVNIVSNVPAAAAVVTANENLKVLYQSYIGALGPKAHFLCGGLAGAFSACVTTPLDNLRTRLNTQLFHLRHAAGGSGFVRPKYGGALSAVGVVLREEGLRGFFKGLSPRVCHHAMSAGVSWMCYEALKRKMIEKRILN